MSKHHQSISYVAQGEKIEKLERLNSKLITALNDVIRRVEWSASIQGTEGYMREVTDNARKVLSDYSVQSVRSFAADPLVSIDETFNSICIFSESEVVLYQDRCLIVPKDSGHTLSPLNRFRDAFRKKQRISTPFDNLQDSFLLEESDLILVWKHANQIGLKVRSYWANPTI